jgi:hypothetical protein
MFEIRNILVLASLVVASPLVACAPYYYGGVAAIPAVSYAMPTVVAPMMAAPMMVSSPMMVSAPVMAAPVVAAYQAAPVVATAPVYTAAPMMSTVVPTMGRAIWP